MNRLRALADGLAVLLGALLVAASFNGFLIPHQLLSGGVSGVAMIIGYFFGGNIGLLYFALNLPILIWGWIAIGRRFVALSVGSVLLTTWFMQLLPERAVGEDPIIGAVFGGVLIGIGVGITLRAGGSTGGMEIVGSIVTRKRDFPLGTVLFMLNSLVVLALGFLFNWDLALQSMLSIFITGKVIDTIHVRHLKLTAFIVTRLREQMTAAMLQLPRGATVVNTEGAYSGRPHVMLMTVLTRYELVELRKIVRAVDPEAFVNVVETAEVIGQFRKQR